MGFRRNNPAHLAHIRHSGQHNERLRIAIKTPQNLKRSAISNLCSHIGHSIPSIQVHSQHDEALPHIHIRLLRFYASDTPSCVVHLSLADYNH